MNRITSFMLMLCVAVTASNAILEVRKYSYGGDKSDTRDTCGALHHEGYHGDGSSDVELDDSSVFELSNCVQSELTGENEFTINCRTDVAWPRGGFCKAVSVVEMTGYREYDVSADLLNQNGPGGDPNTGHPGIAFNVKDSVNFDFIYFRPHSPGGCYQIGWVEAGSVTTTQSLACPNGPPAGRRWFHVKVTVMDKLVRVFMDDAFIVEFQSHFTVGGAVGVIGANGYDNEIRFRNVKYSVPTYTEVSPPNCPFHFTEGPEFSLSRCSTNELLKRDDYFVMTTAPGSRWPANGFCQAFTNTVFRGFSHYKISVLLYNEIGRGNPNLGHPGIIFNAKDYQNYDVIYFRPQGAPSCYQVGYVSQGTFRGGASSKCPAGPPKGRTWFLVEVYVQQGRADVYLDGRYVTEMRTQYGLGGHVGVIAANGYDNTVHFKNLLVKVPQAAN